MNNDFNCVTSVKHEAPMEDKNSAVLYTKETHEVCNLLCVHRAYSAAKRQNNRAPCRSRDTSLCCLDSWSRRTSSHTTFCLPPFSHRTL